MLKKHNMIALFLLIITNMSATTAQGISPEDACNIIEQALTMELPLTDTIHTEAISQIEKNAWHKVFDAHYEEAINIIADGLQTYPANFTLQSFLAMLLGDCAQATAHPLKERMVTRSKELFNKLMSDAERQPEHISFTFMNEYYYRFALHEEQYKLGVIRVDHYWGTDQFNTEGYRGYYSQGVGAANYAKQLIEKGDVQLARDYAQKAVVAWAQYLSYRNDYYNAYVHYALALGILGFKEEMMRALAKSASLITKDMDYVEFKAVIDFVTSISLT